MARKQKKYHYIYKTTNILSGRYYIGMHSTNDLNDGYIGSGTYLKRSINKHGTQNHKRKILEHCNTRQELKDREEQIVNLNEIAKKECMNMKVGGYGGFYSIEACRKGAIATNKILKKKFEIDPDFKKRLYKKAGESNKLAYKEGRKKKNDSFTFKGKKHSEQTKKKISEIKKGTGMGKDNSQYGTCWITNGEQNKKIKKNGLIPKEWLLGRIGE